MRRVTVDGDTELGILQGQEMNLCFGLRFWSFGSQGLWPVKIFAFCQPGKSDVCVCVPKSTVQTRQQTFVYLKSRAQREQFGFSVFLA